MDSKTQHVRDGREKNGDNLGEGNSEDSLEEDHGDRDVLVCVEPLSMSLHVVVEEHDGKSEGSREVGRELESLYLVRSGEGEFVGDVRV